MHQQFEDGRSKMIEQRAVESDVELTAWQEFVTSITSLSEGAKWLLVDENNSKFVKTVL